MQTSLNNIKAIDDYLLGAMLPIDAVLFETNIILNNDLADDVKQQQKTYAIIKEYSRKKLKAEIAAVQEMIITSPQHQGFMQRITNLFKKY